MSSSFFPCLKFFVLILWGCLASDLVISSSPLYSGRSILRALTDGKGVKIVEKPDYAVDLNATDFDKHLKDTPATFAVVEFFAHWCPACRNYKHHFEKVASIFNGADAIHPGIILMARVDCASNINLNLCNKFSVKHFPSLFWGPPSKFVGGSWDPKQEKSEIRPIDEGGTADILLTWINKQLGSSYTLEDEKFKNDIQFNASDPIQIARAMYDVEEATSTAFDIILTHKMIKSETRAYLLKFLQILVAHHPSKRCRKGTAEILIDFDDLYPPKMLTNESEYVSDNKTGLLQSTNICGKEIPRGYWVFCRGSRNDTRGFSCGLWVLLHSVSVRVDDGETQMAFLSTCDFIHNFFLCEDCRKHFNEMCSSVTTPFKSSREFVLWLWDTHNKVNERLIAVEASLGTGDPEHPKIIWPSKRTCPACYDNYESQKAIQWNKDEIFKFLVSYYGEGLVSIHEDKEKEKEKEKEKVSEEKSRRSTVEDNLPKKSTNTVDVPVPVGAAFAIFVVSCGFAAIAWFWRSRQKKRKYKYQIHSLKNI